LFLAVLVSDLAQRSVLSTAPLFLLAGFLVGDRILGWVQLRPESPIVARFAELALFNVLFTDGMRVGIRDLTSAWRLPGRALFLGLPLTLAGTSLLAHVLVGLPWAQAWLLGAALSPTDPVFAAAIVGREEVPVRLRNLLNVESGLNDGLALPVVVLMLAILGGVPLSITMILEFVLGVGLGMAIPWAAARLERVRFLAISSSYEPLYAFSVGLLVLSVASLTHANEFLAAFAAGVTVATVSPPCAKPSTGLAT
jgi:NhaP-type Na+/H+ or K+/H+ antiporter